MISSGSVSPLRLTAYLIPTLVALGVFNPIYAKAQEPSAQVPGAEIQMPDATDPSQVDPSLQIQPTNPSDLRSFTLDSSFLSVQGGERLIQEADQAVASENYTVAASKLQEARQVFNQLSNFYQQLAASFSGVDNRIADEHRNLARDTAQMRDSATYQLALLHRARNQPELAVPLLIQIIRSQAPTRDLGKKAYQQLLELGFVSEPFPRPRAEQPTSSAQ